MSVSHTYNLQNSVISHTIYLLFFLFFSYILFLFQVSPKDIQSSDRGFSVILTL